MNLETTVKLTLFGIGLALLPIAVQAQPKWSPHVEQWGVEEVALSSSHTYANPFADVTLRGEFRSEDRTVKIDGFYDGNGTWKVRMMPDRRGSWTFKTISSDAALNGVTGQFTVDPPSPGNHGPVYPAKTFHFDYADGTPYFLLGTTSYNWLNRDSALQEQTLASLSKTGFTKLRFGLFPKWYKFNRVDPPVFPYVRKADGSFDLDRFDPAFFANVEKRIRALDAMGVQADIILFHPYDNWGFAKMDQAHDEAWLRYVVARLAAYRNVWWTMANEYDLMTPRDWDRLGSLVRASDPFDHPIGIHNFGTWFDPRKPWIDHVIIQDGWSTGGRSAAIARRRYGKPVVVDEYGYEGNNAEGWGELSARDEVARHWDITMAGGYASHGETYVHPDGVLWWAAGGELVGESPARLAFLKTVMTSLPFQDMVPAPELVANGTALAKTGQAYLFRFTWDSAKLFQGRAQIRLAGADLFKVELIDPWEMKIYPLGYTNPGDQAFMLPVAPALLRITAAAKSEGQPKPIGDLAAALAGDLPSTAVANPSLFKVEPIHYSLDFPLTQIEENPAANAVLEKYLPKQLLSSRAAVVPLSILSGLRQMNPDTVHAIEAELAKIPVD